MIKNYSISTSTILKISSVTIAAPRFAGSFGLAAGVNLSNYAWIETAEVYSGLGMAMLEGFALSFILSKWRLLKPYSLAWWSVTAIAILLATTLPLVALPYLLLAQSNAAGTADIFTGNTGYFLQILWNFLVSAVPMLIIFGVGLADVDELDQSRKQASIEQNKQEMELHLRKLAVSTELQIELERSKADVAIEEARVGAELSKRKIRAEHKFAMMQLEQELEQNVGKAFVCESCSRGFESERALRGHKSHCKRLNAQPVSGNGVAQ